MSERDSEPKFCTAAEQKAITQWYLRARHESVAALAKRLLAGRDPAGCKVLDAGCGSGGVTLQLRAMGFDVTGCDHAESSVEQGRADGRLHDAIVADLCALPFADGAFDLVVCSEVLEHIADDAKAMREVSRVARGPMLITVPAHQSLWTYSDELLGHHRRYSRRSFRALLEAGGAEVRALHAFGMLPALFLAAYRPFARRSGKGASAEDRPLAARFKLPRFLDAVLYRVARLDFRLSELGVIPWGHAWWAAASKKSVS